MTPALPRAGTFGPMRRQRGAEFCRRPVVRGKAHPGRFHRERPEAELDRFGRRLRVASGILAAAWIILAAALILGRGIR